MITDEQAVALAQRWHHENFVREDPDHVALTDDELNTLFAWVRERMGLYLAGARSGADGYEPAREDFTNWIGLDLGEPFESNKMLAEQLLDAAEAIR